MNQINSNLAIQTKHFCLERQGGGGGGGGCVKAACRAEAKAEVFALSASAVMTTTHSQCIRNSTGNEFSN